MDALKLIKELKVIPLATLTSEEEVLEVCNCLSLASIPVIEVTLRDERVKNILKYFKNFSNIALGVGTVRTVNDIDLALESGASFIITPGFSSSLSSYAKNKGILLIPGIQTPSEVIQASEAGHKILKFFPAELSGGVERLNAYKSVFPDIVAADMARQVSSPRPEQARHKALYRLLSAVNHLRCNCQKCLKQ